MTAVWTRRTLPGKLLARCSQDDLEAWMNCGADQCFSRQGRSVYCEECELCLITVLYLSSISHWHGVPTAAVVHRVGRRGWHCEPTPGLPWQPIGDRSARTGLQSGSGFTGTRVLFIRQYQLPGSTGTQLPVHRVHLFRSRRGVPRLGSAQIAGHVAHTSVIRIM